MILTWSSLNRISWALLHSDHTKLDLDTLVSLCGSTLSAILDKHAPVKTCLARDNKRGPWYNEEVHAVCRKAWAKERQYRKTPSLELLARFRDQENIYRRIMETSKITYYRKIIDENLSDQKRLFKAMNNIMHRERHNPLPAHNSPKQLANGFLQILQ